MIQNPHKYIFLGILVFIFIGIWAAFSFHKKNLATVDRFFITEDDYLKHLQFVRERMGLPDNGEVRRGILKNMVEEKIFLVEGYRKKFDQDSLGRFIKDFLFRKTLLNMYYDQMIKSRISITDSELVELFHNVNTRVRAKYLLAKSKEEADSILNLLNKGADWNEIARNIFQDSHLKNTGGDLGYFTVDEMELPIEKAAYHLPLHTISKPIKFSKGYAILKVEDRKSNPLLTETEFLKSKPKLKMFLLHRKKKEIIDAYVDSLIRELHIEYNEKNIKGLYDKFTQSKSSFVMEKSYPFQQLDAREWKNKVLLKYDSEKNYTFAEFFQEARYNDPDSWKWIHNINDFKKFINGVLVRQLLLKDKKVQKLSESGSFKDKFQKSFENYLVDRVKTYYQNHITIPEDTLLNYYVKNKDLFAEPPAYKFVELHVKSESVLPKIKSMISKKISLTDILQSKSMEQVEGGDIGFFTSKEFSKIVKKNVKVSVGDVFGPFKVKDGYVYFQCVDKLEGKQYSYDEVKSKVKKAVLYIKWDQYKKEIIDSLKHTMKVSVDYRKLRKIKKKVKEI